LLGLVGVISAVPVAAGLLRCTIYGPSLLLPAESQDVTPPGRPDAAASGGDLTIVAAMQSLDLGVGTIGAPVPTGALPPLGWDLDGVDTCPGPPSCSQAAMTKENCDGDGGRDNTGLELFRTLGTTSQLGVAAVNFSMKAGDYGLVVVVSNYNGQADDTQVSVALLFSNGVLAAEDGGTPQLNHDGTDKWTIDGRSLTGVANGTDCNGNTACHFTYQDDSAYVTNNVLVARSLPEVPITFGGRAAIGGAVMDLQQPILVGTLKSVALPNGVGGQVWKIDNGSISGRWASAKMLANMATIPDTTNDAGGFLCGDSGAYQGLKEYICGLQDIAQNSSGDNNSPPAPCDAISMAFGFTAEPAQLGIVAPIPTTPAGCKQDTIPWSDSCNQ
jgi:hypothetical protein